MTFRFVYSRSIVTSIFISTFYNSIRINFVLLEIYSFSHFKSKQNTTEVLKSFLAKSPGTSTFDIVSELKKRQSSATKKNNISRQFGENNTKLVRLSKKETLIHTATTDIYSPFRTRLFRKADFLTFEPKNRFLTTSIVATFFLSFDQIKFDYSNLVYV